MEQVKATIKEGIPDSTVEVVDLTGTGDHLGITVTSKVFVGKRILQQHKIVMDLLKEELKERIHAVQITTIADKGEE